MITALNDNLEKSDLPLDAIELFPSILGILTPVANHQDPIGTLTPLHLLYNTWLSVFENTRSTQGDPEMQADTIAALDTRPLEPSYIYIMTQAHLIRITRMTQQPSK